MKKTLKKTIIELIIFSMAATLIVPFGAVQAGQQGPALNIFLAYDSPRTDNHYNTADEGTRNLPLLKILRVKRN